MKFKTDRHERRILKRFFLQVLVLTLCLMTAAAILFVVTDKDYTLEIPLEDTFPGLQEKDVNRLTVTLSEDPSVSLMQQECREGSLYLTFHPEKKGDTMIRILDPVSGNEDFQFLTVTWMGAIVDGRTLNFNNYRIYVGIINAWLGGFTILLWLAFLRTRKERMYSYLCVFFSGFAIWMGAIALEMSIALLNPDYHITYLLFILGNSGFRFITLSFPFGLVFAAGLFISNISLIRHESRRIVNLLALGLALVILIGYAITYWLQSMDFAGSMMELRIFEATHSMIASVIVLLECFLIGTMVCGALAARHQPSPDADFIMILGCAIRKDGTLFPLLRGRVDRALELTKVQKDRNGKTAILVPSGGQGRNEVTSEAKAMENYLLQQGVPAEQIMIEDRSANTAENMRFSKELIQQRMPDAKVVFSTTNYHVFRSGLISRQQGFEPEGIGSKTKWYFWPNAAVRELIGMLSYLRRLLLLLLTVIIIITIGLIMVIPM